MKTLTTDQIKQIEDFLISQYNIKYQDTRDEVLDHIACEMEELMNEGIEYETAFKNTFNKWHNELRPHLWVRYNNIPKYLAKQWFWKDTISLTAILLISFGLPYLLRYTIAAYHLSDILTSSSNLSGVILGLIVLITNYKKKGYRINFIKRESIIYLGISLFYSILFLGGETNYKLLSLSLIITLPQVYYFIEAMKVKINHSGV